MSLNCASDQHRRSESASNHSHLTFFQATSNRYNVSATPTFIFFRSGVKLDRCQGGDVKVLEEKIKKWIGDFKEVGGGYVRHTFI